MVELQDRTSEILLDAERQASDPLIREVLLDMQEIQVISSHFINELIRVNLRLRMTERRLLLVNVQPHVCEVLRLLRLDRVFEYVPGVLCVENEQPSLATKHRVDAARNSATLFLRKFASRLALRTTS